MTMLRYALLALPFLSAPVAARDAPKEDIRVRVGIGAQLEPRYVGAKDHRLAPFWDVDIAKGDKPFAFEAMDDKASVAIIRSGRFAMGPTANLESKRRPSDVGIVVDKVSRTFEAGVFAQFVPTQSLRVRADVRKGIGGHEGLVGGISIDKIWRDGDRYVLSVGPRVGLSDARYQRAFFGVTSAESLATGLAAYRPSGGVHSVGMASGLSYQFNPRIGMFGYARYERLVGDAAKSPLVRTYGSRDQTSVGAGLSYSFTVRR